MNTEAWARTVLAGIVTLLIGWVAYETIMSFSFRHQGERCNAQRCNSIEKALEKLELEDRRLQVQIDRLEGHDTETYAFTCQEEMAHASY